MKIQSVLRKVAAYTPISLAVIGLISYLSLGESPIKNPLFTFPYIDKVVHACMYGGLMLTLGFDALWRRVNLSCARIAWFWIASVLLGGLMEILQGSVTQHRSADIYDFAANMVGATVGGFVVYYFMIPLFRRK